MLLEYLTLPFQEVYNRVSAGWKEPCAASGNPMPEVIDHCMKIMDESVLNSRPQTELNFGDDLSSVLLKGLISKKKMLERFSWLPSNLSERGKEMFYGDLYFYCGLCAMLRHLHLAFRATIPLKELLSGHTLSININLRDVKTILNRQFDSVPEKMLLFLPADEKGVLEIKMEQFQQATRSKNLPSCIRMATEFMVENYTPGMVRFKVEEDYLKDLLDGLLIKTKESESQCFSFHVLVDAIQTGLIHTWQVSEIVKCFRQDGLHDHECAHYFKKFISKRIKRVRKGKWQVPDRWQSQVLQDLEVLQMLIMPVTGEAAMAEEPESLLWRDSGRRLAEYLAEPIRKGVLGMVGSESQAVLLERVTRYLIIEKEKGGGGLGQKSLITYLKEEINKR
ncbi:hypothetical protein [Marinilabilia rubra]|uniref:Uncharacterized protein n=1 Tax=Marinilabilia rubra TaxID=2162893 RepID=A0A2U2B766_9BACT|nr:hypothetical protein [Marinilabilia rubra]PWD98908.1 hypothetical protein DDZ16_12980 [Marinilabilia rubra]